MNVVISPAKKLDFETPCEFEVTKPIFNKQTSTLVKELKKCTKEDIKKMMKLSDNLSELNYDRFQNYEKSEKTAAMYAFNGDTYKGLEAKSLSEGDVEYAQSHLHILSGLYGVLRPLDEIRPYRLEMGTRFAFGPHKNLYQFWDKSITNTLDDLLTESSSKFLVNCASEEYFKSVKRDECDFNIIDVKFLENKNGAYKMIGIMAKKARGMMARYIIKNKVKTLKQLQKFDSEGYAYCEQESTKQCLVFKR